MNVGEEYITSRQMLTSNHLTWLDERWKKMVKVKTFATELKIFHTVKELNDLDQQVNEFIEKNNIGRIISVSDTCTTDDKGATIGIIRVIAYE